MVQCTLASKEQIGATVMLRCSIDQSVTEVGRINEMEDKIERSKMERA